MNMIKHLIFYIKIKILSHELPTTLKICKFCQRSRSMFSGISKSKMEKDTLSTLNDKKTNGRISEKPAIGK